MVLRRLVLKLLRFSFFLLAAVAADAAVTVRVLDPTGASVPGATVVLRDAAGRDVATGRTSQLGSARFAADAVEAEVSAAGFRSVTVKLRGQAIITVELHLQALDERLLVEASVVPVAAIAAEVVVSDRQTDAGLVESLRGAPHVHVLRRGGTNFEPVVQGLRETQVAMVVDDTRTFAAGPARMDSELSHIAPGNVHSVEVVTGPYALTEGAGAMGAIVVRTAEVPSQAAWRFGGRLGTGWRSNGTGRMGQARIDAGNPAFGFSLRASGDLLDDYRAGRSGDAPVIHVPGDAATHQFGAKARFRSATDHEILVSGFYDEQTGVDYPGRLLTAEHFLLRGWRASYRMATRDGPLTALKLVTFLNKKSHRMSNRGKPTAMDMPGRRPPFALDVSLPTESDTVGGAGRVELSPSASWSIQAGFDAFRLEQDAHRFVARSRDRMLLFSDAVWAGTALRTVGTYLSLGRTFDRGEVRAAFRLDSVSAAAGRASDFFVEHSGSELESKETNANFSVAGRYDLGGGLTLAGGAGRVVRTANALERFSDRFPSTRFQVAAEFMGTPGIRPESSLQGDLSLEWKAGDFRVFASGYVRSLGDYITVAPDPELPMRLPLSPPVVYRYVNGKSAFFRGWHIGMRRVGARLEVSVQAFKTLADDRELLEPVLGIAPLEMDATARYRAPSSRFWMEYGIRNVWDQRRVSAARLETPSPGFTLHAARFGTDLWKGATLHLGVENMGDKHYYEHLNSLNPFTRQRVPEMGRTLTLGFSAVW